MSKIPSITALRNNMVMQAALGNYKHFKEASKKYASAAVKDFEAVKNTPAPSIKAPLFSEIGFNMFKVWFLNLFRIKTPDEKLLKKMAKEELIKQKYYEK